MSAPPLFRCWCAKVQVTDSWINIEAMFTPLFFFIKKIKTRKLIRRLFTTQTAWKNSHTNTYLGHIIYYIGHHFSFLPKYLFLCMNLKYYTVRVIFKQRLKTQSCIWGWLCFWGVNSPNPGRHKESIQTPQRKRGVELRSFLLWGDSAQYSVHDTMSQNLPGM